MLYSVQRLCEKQLAVVLVERREMAEPRASALIRKLQGEFAQPVILVARDTEAWMGARARAEFDPEPYLYALLAARDIDWTPLPLGCYQAD